jgi:hypothetical protein
MRRASAADTRVRRRLGTVGEREAAIGEDVIFAHGPDGAGNTRAI